jgi:hypothetical protein
MAMMTKIWTKQVPCVSACAVFILKSFCNNFSNARVAAKNPCWYFIIKMKIAAQRAALVDSVSGRKALADKNDHY